MADRDGWRPALEAELRGLGRELGVPPAADVTRAVRQRLEQAPAPRRQPGVPGTGGSRLWRPAWRAAVVILAILAVLLVATPQGRALITHVLRFAGVELRQEPGPALSPGSHGSLPGERRMPLGQARRAVSFPILVPAALGRPDEVVVSDRGRVASLIYREAPGQVRLDEFAGHLDPVFFRKFVLFGNVTQVSVNGVKGLWIKGPHELVYIPRGGGQAVASPRLTTGNTLIWGTRGVALRLEGALSRHRALAIAASAR